MRQAQRVSTIHHPSVAKRKHRNDWVRLGMKVDTGSGSGSGSRNIGQGPTVNLVARHTEAVFNRAPSPSAEPGTDRDLGI